MHYIKSGLQWSQAEDKHTFIRFPQDSAYLFSVGTQLASEHR